MNESPTPLHQDAHAGHPPVDDFFLRQLCLQGGVPTIALDTDLRVVFWNRAAEGVVGRTADEMAGQSLLAVVPEARRSLAERLLKRILAEGGVSEFDFSYRRPDGTPVDLAVTLARITDTRGGPRGVAVHLRDTTRRVETERALAQNRKMSALGTMAGAVAHHFNNLLGGLVTTLDFARQCHDRSVIQRALGSMTDTLNRAITITRALLAFAEGDRADDEVGDVRATVQQFAARVAPELADRKIALETRIDEIQAELPSRKLNTILESLTANAWEAMPEGGHLKIELMAAEAAGELILNVSDTGGGIADSDLEHVFEPFFSTKKAASDPRTAHLGLGLAVVHGIVQDLGGTVTLCSSRDSGTICSVRLPRTVRRP